MKPVLDYLKEIRDTAKYMWHGLEVTFEKKPECDLEEYRDLQNRIEELKSELEDPWEDEDEDGGLIVRK